MTCKEIADFLMDYTTGELSSEVRLAFKQHLHECPECVAYLKSYEETVRLTRSLAHRDDRGDAREPPSGLIKAILQARKAQTT